MGGRSSVRDLLAQRDPVFPGGLSRPGLGNRPDQYPRSTLFSSR
jgi:hypothetical protein